MVRVNRKINFLSDFDFCDALLLILNERKLLSLRKSQRLSVKNVVISRLNILGAVQIVQLGHHLLKKLKSQRLKMRVFH